MSHSSEEPGGIVANRRDVLRTAGGLAVATALAGALFEANTDTASAQKGNGNTITGTLEGLDTGTGAVSFQVLSFSFGATNAGSGSVGGGAGAGKVSFSDISFTKSLDGATVGIFGAVATGRGLDKATFVVTGQKGVEIAKIEIEDVLITGQQFSSTAEGTSTESVSVNYAIIALSVAGTTKRWNLKTNVSE